MPEPLKSCPFCGGAAKFIKRSVGIPGTMGHDAWHAISCGGCNAGIAYDDNRFRDKDDAAKAWNRRSLLDGDLSKKIIMFQEELIHLSGRYDQLLTAMLTIAGGSFHSATSLAIEGDWKGFTDKLQDIAITALNQTGEL